MLSFKNLRGIKRIISLKKNIMNKVFSTTIFDKIVSKQIKSEIIFEDEKVLVFKDVNPVAKVHVLIIPKNKDGLIGLAQAEDKHKDILGHMLLTATKVGQMLNLKEGYRLVINQGPYAGQTIDHLHIHMIGGEQLTWPPGTKDNKNSYEKQKL